jgi:DNA-binding transcriptional LysR family regulator
MIRDLGQLRTFLAIASLRSYSKAAEKLGMSRAMASKHIQDLETDLGVKLFNRTTRQLSLTEPGETLQASASALLEGFEAVEQELRSRTKTPKGNLRISAPMSFGIRHMGPIINGFLKRFPEMTLDIRFDDRVTNIVEEGIDVAIRIRTLPDSSLVARRLATARMVLCASPDYLQEYGEPRHPEDLREHQCLIYEYLARQGTWSLQKDGGRADVRIQGPIRANNGDSLVEAAIDGWGIILTPTFIAHEALRSGKLIAVLRDWRPVEPQFYAVMPPGRDRALKVRVFVDHLAGAIGEEPYWDAGLPL